MKLEYCFRTVIALITGFTTGGTVKRIHNIFLRETLTILALCVNYIFAHTLIFIWNQPHYCYYIFTLVVSLLFGLAIMDFARSILYVGISFVVGAVAAIGITIAPLILSEAGTGMINAGILKYSQLAVRLLIVSLPLCILVAVLGCFLGEDFQAHKYLAREH